MQVHVDEIANEVILDQNDESLRKWKESLGIGSGNTISDPNDPRTVIILSLGLEVSRHCSSTGLSSSLFLKG